MERRLIVLRDDEVCVFDGGAQRLEGGLDNVLEGGNVLLPRHADAPRVRDDLPSAEGHEGAADGGDGQGGGDELCGGARLARGRGQGHGRRGREGGDGLAHGGKEEG